MSRCTIAHRLLHFWCAKERSGSVTAARRWTLKQTPIVLLDEIREGCGFDVVETIAIDDVIVALTLPPSSSRAADHRTRRD